MQSLAQQSRTGGLPLLGQDVSAWLFGRINWMFFHWSRYICVRVEPGKFNWPILHSHRSHGVTAPRHHSCHYGAFRRYHRRPRASVRVVPRGTIHLRAPSRCKVAHGRSHRLAVGISQFGMLRLEGTDHKWNLAAPEGSVERENRSRPRQPYKSVRYTGATVHRDGYTSFERSTSEGARQGTIGDARSKAGGDHPCSSFIRGQQVASFTRAANIT